MHKILIIILFCLFLPACSSQDNSANDYYSENNTPIISTNASEDIRRRPYSHYDFVEKRKIIRRYRPPKTLENKSSMFTASFPPTKIAILLPLSGKFSKLGKDMLDAAQLALFSIDEPNLILVPIDTKGTAFGAIEAAKKAVLTEVRLILGPIFSQSAKAISTITQENNINVVSFSNDKSLMGSGVFAIGFLPEQQIRRIVEFAMTQGIEDFTTVLPNNTYGATAAKELRETVLENDMASVLKTEIYRKDKKGNPIKLRKHVFSAFNSAMNTKPPKDFDEELQSFNFNPIKFPRALLVPEDGKALDQITALLKKYKFSNESIQLLGSSQWYTPKILRNSLLDGAWFAGPPHKRRANFEHKFQSIYARKPNKLTSLAYDGIALSAALARLSRGKDFSKNALSNPRGFMGVDGIFRLKKDGLTERGLAIMKIHDGQFEIVDPAPTNFVDIKEKDNEDS